MSQILLKGIAYQFLLLLLLGCASIAPPSGGKKDINPPKVLNITPRDSSTNFFGNKIIIEFDENVSSASVHEKLIISPYYPDLVDISAVKNELILTFPKPLKKDITYTLSFRDGIKDINEGNALKELTLFFSTKNNIDTNQINGTVINAITQKPVSNALVCLTPITDTFNILISKPFYLTKTRTNGSFSLQHIKEGTYKLFAYEDINKNHEFNEEKEKAGIHLDPIILPGNYDTLSIPIAKYDHKKPKLQNIKEEKDITLSFNEALLHYSLRTEKDSLLHELSENRKSIIIYKTFYSTDTIPITLYVCDSSMNDTTYNTKIVMSKPKKEIKKLKTLIKQINPESTKFQYNDSINISIQLYDPCEIFGDSIITFLSDSLKKERVNVKKKFNHNKSKTLYTYTYKRKIKKQLELSIPKKMFISYQKDTNTSFYAKYTAHHNEYEQKMQININTKETSYIIEILDKNQKTIYEKGNATNILFKHIEPGEYLLRAIIDENKNGKWDKGHLVNNIAPEKIIYYKEPIIIRANWEIEDLIFSF